MRQLLAVAQEQAQPRFSYQFLSDRARTMADTEFRPENRPELPEILKKLSYDDYQKIRFLAEQGPWRGEGLKFSLQCFHRGFIYQDPVRIHLIEQGQVRDFQFSSGQFDYGGKSLDATLPADLNFAGLRVLYPMNAPDKQDEVVAFLGASYFRLIGAHQRYGASARGLAIDTAEASGEEFPRFTDFWIEKPGAMDSSLRMYALMDSPSTSGAYRFVIEPGETTHIEVEAKVYFRKEVKKLGIAALTSMFLAGENRTRPLADFRPEIHDSDGLLLGRDDVNWTWRPLINPDREHVVTSFPVDRWKCFGLLQRDRQFDHYQDLGSRYELRPSLWVEPHENWGNGSVELVEIPTAGEWNDNIVAYWVPQQKAVRGEEYRWTYRISAGLSEPEKTKLLRVEATRLSPEHDKSLPRFVIDFAGEDGASPPADARVEATVEASRGTIRNLVTEKNEVTGGWRSFFDLADAGKEPSELRLYLHRGKEVLSEVWEYRYQRP
jgi:glucans biosynthesis protein